MKRKVIQLNPTTMAVTLPKKWVDENNIKKGQELSIEEDKKSLLINPVSAEKVSEKARVDFVKQGIFEKNVISTLYQVGIDEIEIIYDNPEIIPIIQRHIEKYLVGFDLVEETKTRLVIKSITKDILLDFDNTYKKNIQVMIQMMKEINEAVQKDNYSNINITRNLEQNENKLQSLCLRYISKNGFPEKPNRERAAYELVREIENICDCLKRICDVLIGNKLKINSALKNLFYETNLYVANFYNVYYSENKENLKFFYVHGKKILNECYELFDKTSGKQTLLVHHLIDIINRVYFLSHPLVEIKTDIIS